ncbi:MAG TPA: hypothetical protein VMW50_01405 [Dehalococcoidia bacterium]|nr:hypothetical protein [Dehalococcoidia bacterium]
MSVFQTQADRFGDGDSLLDGEPVLGRLLNQPFHIAPGHEGKDHIGLPFLLPEVKYGDDVRVITKPSHGLGFAFDAGSGRVIQFLDLKQGKGHVPVE